MNRINAFNQRVAAKITTFVSTMWGAYFFAAIALISLPAAIRTGDVLVIIAWVTQTLLQLVLLSIIMVGQKTSSASVEQIIRETHEASVLELKELKEIAHDIRRVTRDIEGKK